MALLLKNNIIYLHIPKTGGTTLRELFKKNNLIKYEIGYKHATLDRVGNINRGNINNLFFEVYKSLKIRSKKINYFTVIRNPISWYESIFNYTNKKKKIWGKFDQINWHPLSDLNKFLESNDFNQFMDKINLYYPGYLTSLYSRYINLQTNIIKLENLEKELSNFLSSNNISIELNLTNEKKLNKSLEEPITWHDSILEETYKNEILIFKRYNYNIPYK
tara:strand:- start:608 stop:1264 length:657 start_codon:yes stop_codon:yes gene_type:complete